MSETKSPGEKRLSVSSTKTLTLKRGVEQGVVRQSFSHGRTKPVVVEKVKRRVVGDKPEAAPSAERVAAGLRPTAKAATASPTASPAASPKPSGVVLRTLTDDERTARAHALADARVREAEERKIAEEEARRRAEREARERVEREAAEARKRDEESRRKHDEETKKKAEQEAKKRFGEDETRARVAGAGRQKLEAEEDEAPRTTRRAGGAARPAAAPKAPRGGGGEKRRGRLTLVTALNADEVRERSVASFRRRVQRMSGHREDENKEKIVREVIVPETITIQELANRMAERAVDVVRILMKQGHLAKSTDLIDADTAQLLAEELGHTVRRVAESDVEEGLFDAADDPCRAAASTAGRHHHGPRRPRQDVAARCHSFGESRSRRGRRHHAAHRRLSGGFALRDHDHVHRYARPRGIHRDAGARRQSHRRGGVGRGGR